MGPGHGIVLAIGLERAREHPTAIAMKGGETPDVYGPEIHRRLAARDPFGERPASAPGARDPEGVETGANIEAVQLRRFAENEIPVGREGLRTIDEALDPGGLQRRDACE